MQGAIPLGHETLEGDIAKGGSIQENELETALFHKRCPVPNLNAIDPILSRPKGASRPGALGIGEGEQWRVGRSATWSIGDWRSGWANAVH